MSFKGRKHSPETIEKMRKSAWNKGRTGVYTEEQLERMRKAHKGHYVSDETRKKLSVSHLGKVPGNKGMKYSKEVCERISAGKKGKSVPWSEERKKKFKARMTGENHPLWVKDRTKLSRKTSGTERMAYFYSFWRKQVKDRDGHRCRINNGDCRGRLEVHHILPWRDFPELRYEVNNGITLCHAHHPYERAEEKRLIPTFQELVAVSKDLVS